ncbi:hypothetical protein [Pseudomonas tussilaginis]|uniref:hypothetical protein n=1 Tax=Pseudomonas sp. 5 TaxID=1619949 RepID=UPI000A965489|nr:hypothetical protein [Pseudomonas sp. 5]
MEAIPEALGPMLMTLISEAKAFEVTSFRKDYSTNKLVESKRRYNKSACWMLQQRAINRLLGWIVINAHKKGNLSTARLQFEEACMRMSRFGAKSKSPGQTYCSNRLKMDNFMAEGVQRLHDRLADEIRAEYRASSAVLGARQDNYCERRQYYGRDYISSGVAKYIGPGQ